MFKSLKKRSFIVGAATATAMAWIVSAAPLQKEAATDLDQWSQDLANHDFEIRERATHELWMMGTAALPRLKELVESRDPEQAIRARELVRKIEMGVFPDSDPELLVIVERYPDADPSEKLNLLRELQRRRAWKQMLKLYERETDPAVRSQQQSTMHRIAVYAARELLSQKKPEEALEMLKLSPSDQQSLLARADYHRVHGTLDAELKKAYSRQGDDAVQWRIALLRCAGKIDQALAEIEPGKQAELHAGLAALSGDPIPWLQLRSSSWEEEARRTRNETQTIYARLAADRWSGNTMDPGDLEKLLQINNKRSSSYRQMARVALFMLGEQRTAEDSLMKDNPIEAAFYLLIQERLDEALEVLGHTPQNPCTKEWVSLQFDNLGEDGFRDFEDSRQARSLCLMAGFLENRGLHDLAYDCFREPAIDYAAKDKAGFLDFITRLCIQTGSYSTSPQLAVRIASDWAGEDADRWSLVADAFWSGDEDSHECWTLLHKLKPEADLAQRLKLVLMIMRRIPSEDNQRQEFLNLAWKYYENAEEGLEKQSILRFLINLAFNNAGDAELSTKVWQLIPDDYHDNQIWKKQISHLSARDDWDGVCELLSEQLEQMKERSGGLINPAFHAYVAASMRRAGRLEEARHHDRMANLLCLGDSHEAIQIASAYAFAGDYERSREWWKRAALTVSPDSSIFPVTMVAYAENLLLEPSEWRRVAALNEVAVCESIENYYDDEVPLREMRMRLKSDVYRALSILKDDRERSIEILAKCHQDNITDGVLADFFFPVLRVAGLEDEHDQWFDETWKIVTRAIDLFPETANTRNTAGWLASRAQRELEAAEKIQKHALELYPDQAAYLDTMAEIHFAKGNRKEALRWSKKAILSAPLDTELRRQYHHFANDPLPKR